MAQQGRAAARLEGLPSGPRETVCDLTGEEGSEALDGMKVDRDGRLYVCGPGGLFVLDPGGAILGKLTLPESPHNLAWGDADGRTLYLTAHTSVYRLRMAVEGVRTLPRCR